MTWSTLHPWSPTWGCSHRGHQLASCVKMKAKLLPKAHVAQHGPAVLITPPHFTSHPLPLIFCAQIHRLSHCFSIIAHTPPSQDLCTCSSLCLVSPSPSSMPDQLLHASFEIPLHRMPLSLSPYLICDYILIYLATCLLLGSPSRQISGWPRTCSQFPSKDPPRLTTLPTSPGALGSV